VTTGIRVAAVLLAAGSSERFGRENKLLAEICGEPLLRRVARVVIAAGLSDVVVVTGHQSECCRGVLKGLAIRYVHNTDWPYGMGKSIAAGIEALHPACQGVFIVPTDMPNLTSTLFVRLRAAFDVSGGSTIVFPVTSTGEQRNPVLWPQAFFPDLRALSGATGAKTLLLRHTRQSHVVPLGSDGEAADIDTLADLTAARDSRAHSS
jgi:molybdenum cofactor cytidylyltransferase